MPSEQEELVEFLHHPNPQIRQIACENAAPFSLSQPALFKHRNLEPLRDLKTLVNDFPEVSTHALPCLINLSADQIFLKELAEDDQFLETLLSKVTNPRDKHVQDVTQLLANIAKHPSMKRIISLKRTVPLGVSASEQAFDQLMDCFIKGDQGLLNDKSTGAENNYDYLAYLFADISSHKEGRDYFTTQQAYDGVIPISKLVVFTEHPSNVRRSGVASTFKNVAFETDRHSCLLSPSEINILPYLLLPLAGPEEFDDEESSKMLPDLQLLPPEKKRDSDNTILITHLETLLLLTSTRPAREMMREVQVYPIIRECHLHVDDDDVRDACDRLVQLLIRNEEGEEAETAAALEEAKAKAIEDGTLDAQETKTKQIEGAGDDGAQQHDEEDSEDEKIVAV